MDLKGGLKDSALTYATGYLSMVDKFAPESPTLTDNAVTVNVDGTLVITKVDVKDAPGIGKSWTWTIMVNGTPSTSYCTISGTIRACSMSDLSLSAGDLINVQVSSVGSPASGNDSKIESTFSFGAPPIGP